MRLAPFALALMLGLPRFARAQDTARIGSPPTAGDTARARASAPRPVPVGILGMRLGLSRSAFPDSACARNDAGEEWCSPRPFQRMLVRDSVVVALEAPVGFLAPDSLSVDTVWSRFVMPRLLRFLGPPDSARAADSRTTLWWNWDGSRGPRRSLVIGAAEPDSTATKVATVIRIECVPGTSPTACFTLEQRRP